MHVHVDFIACVVTCATIVIFGFFWRIISSRLSDTKVGQAMSFIY